MTYRESQKGYDLVAKHWLMEHHNFEILIYRHLYNFAKVLCKSVMETCLVLGNNVSGCSETLFSFFTNNAVGGTSLVRSHVVFKFLNYVTDKIVRVVLTTLALMLRCVQTMCICEGEGRE